MTETVYFGTYTRRLSEGIYKADFDTDKGVLSKLTLLAEEPSPTYLAFDKKDHLYSVGAHNQEGGIAAYSSQGTLLNHVVEQGAPLCYVAVDEERDLVFGANYHKGQVLVYKRLADGSLELADSDTHQGSGPHENQASAHVHFADLTPDKCLVTCDLGTDQLVTYDLSPEGKLTKIGSYNSNPGAGPRHIVFHPYYKTAYLICELNSTVEVLAHDGMGQFDRLQTISTLPEDFKDFNGTAAIRLTKDGKHLYASNRGHDSIVHYGVGPDGLLTLVESVATQGKNPRDFALTPDEKYIIAVHQDSDNASVFDRNSETGRLTLLSHDFVVPEGVCVTFQA